MKVSGSQTVQIAAPPARCREAIVDFASYPDWFPGAREASVVDSPPDAPSGRLLFSAGIPALPDLEIVLRYVADGEDRLSPEVVSGDLRISGSGWTLSAAGDGRTEVTYDVTVELDVPGGFVAERAFKGPARRYLIEEPPERLRGHVESG